MSDIKIDTATNKIYMICSTSHSPHIAVLGGGAAGSFAAIEIKRALPNSRVTIFERTETLLAKVKISGGGRCNVTHACFDPKRLAQYYPRGSKFLLPLFHRFQPSDTIAWFEKEGVFLKEEEDGRMFPSTNSSDSIIQVFLRLFETLSIFVQKSSRLYKIVPRNDQIELTFLHHDVSSSLLVDTVVVATGSHPEPLRWMTELGLSVTTQVPSLFTFNCPHSPFLNLAGVSVEKAKVSFTAAAAAFSQSKNKQKKQLYCEGPLLITHWGFSGPAILKLSAFYARELHEAKYNTSFTIDWAPDISFVLLQEMIHHYRTTHVKKSLFTTSFASLPKSLFESIVRFADVNPHIHWGQLSRKDEEKIIQGIKKSTHILQGKTTYKSEFVTAGGISLDEVHATTMSSKKHPWLFFAGEVLDIDGVTGGFNFQAAWTTAHVAAQGIYSYFHH